MIDPSEAMAYGPTSGVEIIPPPRGGVLSIGGGFRCWIPSVRAVRHVCTEEDVAQYKVYISGFSVTAPTTRALEEYLGHIPLGELLRRAFDKATTEFYRFSRDINTDIKPLAEDCTEFYLGSEVAKLIEARIYKAELDGSPSYNIDVKSLKLVTGLFRDSIGKHIANMIISDLPAYYFQAIGEQIRSFEGRQNER